MYHFFVTVSIRLKNKQGCKHLSQLYIFLTAGTKAYVNLVECIFIYKNAGSKSCANCNKCNQKIRLELCNFIMLGGVYFYL